MGLTANEIEYGRLAIQRNLATREQVRECADLRSQGSSEHIARLLVARGYVSEADARNLYQELHSASGYDSASGSNYSGGGAGSSAFGSNFGAGAYGAPTGSGYGPPAGSGFGSAPGSGYGAPAGSGYGPPGGSGFGTAPGSGYGPPSGPTGTHGYGGGHGTARFDSHGTGQYPGPGRTAVLDPHGAPPAPYGGAAPHGSAGLPLPPGELPPNLAPDDPIAHVMTVRHNPDGTVEAVFGPYDILGEIARGGMGIVYRARQRSLKRIVALKVMKEGENASEKQVRRFKRETEAAAKLQHPNIVAVHEVGQFEGFHYFTMDLIEGDPLDAIVKRSERMPVERVLQIVMEVAQAIHYAHGKGIIHRDLKPANVLLDTDGHPKVTDFGLAKNIDHKSMLTRTGAVVGTPFYMPPEQARGDVDIDQRADVYALGVILYELLTLKLPFYGETTMEVYHKILEDEPLPPRKHDSRLDADVNTIVLKAMEKELSRRYQTSLELAEDIQRYLNGDPIKARPLGPVGRLIKKARKNMPVVIVTACTVLALTLSLSLIWWRKHQLYLAELEKARNAEWETYVNEVENQCINARSQISSATARRRDRDVQSALNDLDMGLQYLRELEGVGSNLVYHTPEDTGRYLRQQAHVVNGIYRDIYLEMGKAQVLRGDSASFERALKAYATGLERSPDAPELQLEIGRVQTLQGKFDEALATFSKIQEKFPKRMDARLEIGRVHDRAGRPLEALKYFAGVVEYNLGPVDKDELVLAHLLRGQTLYRLERFEDARRDFDRALDLKDDLFEGYIWRGRTLQALGQEGAEEDLTEAIDLNPSLPDGYYYRGLLHFERRKHAEAIKDFEVAISRSGQYYPAYLGLGRALEWVLDYERAEQQYQEVVSATAQSAAANKAVRAEALAALGNLALVQADPWECQLEADERARGQEGAPPATLAQLKSQAAELQAQRQATAQKSFDEALTLQPDQLEALRGRACLALQAGKLDDAARDLQSALKALDARPAVRFGSQLGGGARQQREERNGGGDWDDWEEGTQRRPAKVDLQLADARALVALTTLRQGDRAKAQQQFKAALEVNPDQALARGGLGLVAHAAVKPDAARPEFEEARRLQVEGTDEAAYFYQEGLRYQGLASRSKKPDYFKQARQSFARALARNPIAARVLLERANLTAEWSAFDAAVLLAERAVEVDPTLREGHELLGFLFARDLPAERDPVTGRPEHLRDCERAKQAFDRAVEVAGAPEAAAHARYGRALALLALGEQQGQARVREALADLEAAAKSAPTDFSAVEPREINNAIAYLEELARVHEKLGQQDAAQQARKRVEEVKAKALEAARKELEEGRVQRDRLSYAEAIKRFDRAIELNPLFDDAYYDRGTCYLKIGNFVPGILDFSRALELNPRIADQVYNKVYQISYVVDLNRVITELNKIVSDHPNVSYVIFLRGFFYVAKTEFKRFERSDLEMGIGDFDRCLELNPTHVTALLYRGFLWFKMASLDDIKADKTKREECYDKAMKDYLHALELDPISGISHYLQALSFSVRSTEEGISPEESKARKARALDELRQAFSSDFKGYERIKNEAGFDSIRNDPAFQELMRGK